MHFKTRLIIILFLMITGIGLILKNFFIKEPLIVDHNRVFSQSLIEYPSKYNYRQTINDCGPFNTSAVIRALKGEDNDPQFYVKKMTWRLPNKYTIPWGLENQLNESGISTEVVQLKTLSDDEKIIFLKERLSQKKPIIILGGRDNYEHYLTLFGFDSNNEQFYIYDSLFKKNDTVEGLTVDDNYELPGNRNYTNKELLNFWENGGMYGLFQWYAIVANR